jgi:hypothetical protein
VVTRARLHTDEDRDAECQRASCRFYERMGATLGEIHRFGYAAAAEVAHEVMLCWYFDLNNI